MEKNVDYKLLYLNERVNALKHELAFLQSRFARAQQELQQATVELKEYESQNTDVTE